MTDFKTAYVEVAQILADRHDRWTKVFDAAKTPETMAKAWITTFDMASTYPYQLYPYQVLSLAILSLRYAASSMVFDLLRAFVDCDSSGSFDWPTILNDYETEIDPAGIADRMQMELYRNDTAAGKRSRILADLRTCFIQFVGNRFADSSSVAQIRSALRLFYNLLIDPTLAMIAQRSEYGRQSWYGSVTDQQLQLQINDCFSRAVASQPNWNLHGLQSMIVGRKNNAVDTKRFADFRSSGARSLPTIKAVYGLVDRCMFPQLFGPPPAGFFDNYRLDDRTGNYIPFDRINAGPEPVDGMIDTKSAAAPVLFQQTPSGSVAAAAAAYRPTAAASAYSGSTSFAASSSSTAAAAKKGGGAYPFSVSSYF